MSTRTGDAEVDQGAKTKMNRLSVRKTAVSTGRQMIGASRSIGLSMADGRRFKNTRKKSLLHFDQKIQLDRGVAATRWNESR